MRIGRRGLTDQPSIRNLDHNFESPLNTTTPVPPPQSRYKNPNRGVSRINERVSLDIVSSSTVGEAL